MTKNFSRKYLVEELKLPYNSIYEQPIEATRWSIIYVIVFQDKDGSYWKTSVSLPATEIQDEEPWEFEDEVECERVKFGWIRKKEWIPIEQEEEE